MASVLSVEVTRKSGKRKTVDAICITGNFALHYDLDGTGLMRVTHRKTGLCFPALFQSEQFARLFMELLVSRPSLWETEDPKEFVENFRGLAVALASVK